MIVQTQRRSSVSARSRHTSVGRKFWATVYIRTCTCVRAFPPCLEKKKEKEKERKSIRFAAALWRPMSFPFSVFDPHVKICRYVGRGYVGEPSPLVPFGISPYVLHFLSLYLSLFFTLTLLFPTVFHPFSIALLFSVFLPLPVSPFLASRR